MTAQPNQSNYSNGLINKMVNELETITYHKHHYVRKTGLKKKIKAILEEYK